MKNHCLNKDREHAVSWRLGLTAGMVVLMTLIAGGCARSEATRWQGYLEGEFIYVGAPLAGLLESLAVEKGARVEAQAVLFSLERQAELAAQQQASAQLQAVLARLEDLRKGARPSELAGLEAQVEQARATAELAQIDFRRIETLRQTDVVAESEFDRARLMLERAKGTLDQLGAQLATARLGGRVDVIAAAEAEAQSARAAKAKADWSVEQKSQRAPRAALVYDTLYRAGEFVPAGNPVVSLLAPELLKVRFFVPEAEFATLKSGDPVQVTITGREPLTARISFMSPQPEYTPPVLYNRENRAKLVFMIEATFQPGDALDLHPGQPVDVTR
ncbi:MAG TPA: HlyD family efflux transporter periplasmic adaptor subunit [Opitutus sp.]|nr:HlyD family efflux transporter periplasmic adaptor subunit [Opitutus sp.]